MFSMKLGQNRSYCELLKIYRRMSTVKNGYSISKVQDYKTPHTMELICDNNGNYRRWMKQIQPNNIISDFYTPQQTVVESSQADILSLRDLMATFPDIIKDLTDTERNQEFSDAINRFVEMIKYTTNNGNKYGGIMLVSSYKLLEDPEKLTPENIRLANILGWCEELYLSFIMICDDIVDCSETRRGALCLHRQPEIGLTAINDGLMLEHAVYILMKKYFRDHPAYVPIMELFHNCIYKVMFGQNFDAISVGPNGRPMLEMLTMERYTTLINSKSSNNFYPPVLIAMYLAGRYEEEQHTQAKAILSKVSHFLQVQNDVLDCFGDPSVSGKIGSDIQVGKCSWLAVMALQKATPAQWKIMEEHYGRSEPESVVKVKRLYEDLDLQNMYTAYREEIYNTIVAQIKQISKGPFLDMFYKVVEDLILEQYIYKNAELK